MDIFYTEELGRMPFVLNDFRFLDKIYRSTFEAYLKMLSAENMILFGCIVTDNLNGTFTVSEGAVVINNEFYLCSSHTFPCDNINEAYFVVNQTADTEGLKKFGNNTMIDTYLLRRVLASQHASQPSDSISVSAYKFEDLYVKSGDSRLTDSRTCNNTFDNIESSRTYLDVYSKSETGNEIVTAINALINGAPGALDTLNELADALGDDPNFAATITNALANKVDKDGAKVLSANDFTDALLAKLNGLNNLPTSHSISFITGLQAALDSKVNKDGAKVLSTNDFTTTLLNKLNNIQANATNYSHPSDHAISFITGLQAALDAKENKSNNPDQILKKKINIGTWAMNGTSSKSIAHGLDITKIVNIQVFIFNNDQSDLRKLDYCYPAPATVDVYLAGRFNANATNVELIRQSSRFFDSTDYASTVADRGYILIEYLP